MKLFVSDYDGTLNRGGGVTREDLDAIRTWKSRGNLFGVATGRDFKSFASVWGKILVCPDFIVGSGGPQIYTGVGNRIIDLGADGQDVPAIADLIIRRGGKIVHFMSGTQRYIVALDGVFPEGKKDIYVPVNAIPAPDRVHSINTYFDTTEQAIAFCREVNMLYGDRFTAFNNTCCGDIVPKDCGKMQGIAAYIEYAGIEPEEVITAGDSGNDIEMLTRYTGYAPESADEEVLSALPPERIKPNLAAMLAEHL